jgi:glucose/arabinose dehydrogenase
MTMMDWLRRGGTGFKWAPVRLRRATQPALRRTLIGASAATIFVAAAAAGNEALVFESEVQRFRVMTVAEGLEHPWAVAFLPDGAMLIAERPGRLRVIREGALAKEPIKGVPKVYAKGEGGLLDVALHPQFEKNRLVYLSYAASRPSVGNVEGVVATTVVARGRLNGEALEDVKVIFTAEPWTAATSNFGARLLFAPGGFLFVTVGDRGGAKEEAQNLANDLGKIIRIRDDGAIPTDNPFVNKPDARPEIYSYGRCNVRGLAERPAMRQIWAHEHSRDSGDEVNLVKPGGNRGWPRITFSGRNGRAARPDRVQESGPSGMTFYMGDRFPNWQGNLFIGSLAGRRLRRVAMERDVAASQEELLGDLGEPIRDVRTGPDGFIYVLTAGERGRLLRLEPAPSRDET